MIHLATTKAILAAMLVVAQPGHSQWSRTDIVGDCDYICQEMVKEFSGSRPVLNYSSSRAKWPGWTRKETREEGMARYVDIARAITRVAHDPPPEWVSRSGRPYSSRELWVALVTISRHESAYWKAVHSGRILGLAGEHCMMQIHPKSRVGVKLDTLVGLDRDATERCFRAGAKLLGRSRKACERHAGGPDGWFRPTIAAYGSGQGCTATAQSESVGERVVTFATVAKKGRWIRDPMAIRLLEESEIDDFHGSMGVDLPPNEWIGGEWGLSGQIAPRFSAWMGSNYVGG